MKILRKIILISAFLLFTVVLLAVFAMEASHGDLTPNGNRYYDGFSLRHVDWWSMLLLIAAYATLLLPWIRFGLAKHPAYKWGIFPAANTFGKILSTLLTLWNLLTGGLFSLAICYYSYISIAKSRILLDDEYPLIIIAYVLCIAFWGTVNVIYAGAYKKTNQTAD